MTFRITLFLLLTTFVLGGCFEETEYHYEDLGDGDPADADSFEENPPGDEDGMESDRFADADFDADGDLDLADGSSDSDFPETPDGDGEMGESDGDAGEIDPEIDPEPEDPCDGAPSPVVEAIDPDVGTTPAWRATAILDQAAIVCEDGRTLNHGEYYAADWGNAVAGISETEAIFGAHNGLWRYTATPTPEIRCIAGLEESVYSIAVREREGEEEIVVGLRDRVGILSADSWRFVPVAEVWSPETRGGLMGEGSPAVWDIHFHGDSILIQTIQGVAMQDENGVFVPLDGCCGYEPTLPYHEDSPFPVTGFRYIAPKTWTGMAFQDSRAYVGAPGALLEIDLESRSCRPLCRAEDAETRYIVQGMTPEGVRAVSSKPGYTMFVFDPKMPYTLDAEVGECTFQGIWKVHYRPGEFFPFPTFVKGRVGADGQWVGAFASFNPNSSIYFCEMFHYMYSLPGQQGGIERIIAGQGTAMDWGLPCYLTTSTSSLTADVFMDSVGGWYSPGFWRIDYANETEE